MKTAGIIGGLGPVTTAEFYLELIKRSRRVNTWSYPSLLICSLPVPFSVERDMVTYGRGEEEMLKVLSGGVSDLERMGADFAVIPCNTVHIFYDKLKDLIRVPLLNILTETARTCYERKWSSVGVLGTKKTLQSRMYADALESYGLSPVELDEGDQEKLSMDIYRILTGRQSTADRTDMLRMIQLLKEKGADGVILGCTDIQLLIHPSDEDLPIPAIDSMSCLVDATVRELRE